jgi:hypothetical protein
VNDCQVFNVIREGDARGEEERCRGGGLQINNGKGMREEDEKKTIVCFCLTLSILNLLELFGSRSAMNPWFATGVRNREDSTLLHAFLLFILLHVVLIRTRRTVSGLTDCML